MKILSLAINTVTIKNKQNITFEFGICHFYTILHCFFFIYGIHIRVEYF